MAKTASNQEVTEHRSTDRLLKVIIALLVRQPDKELAPLKKQIEILSNLGMRPVEIAETLGRTQTHINKELAGIRKSSKKGD